jgi:transcriptional regulator with XRE-family HTH domain
MRAALAGHDFGAVYQVLIEQDGYTQAQIGQLTGQRQPEVSTVLNGRKILFFAVLVRVASGLGIPPGYVGLACCPCPHTCGNLPQTETKGT